MERADIWVGFFLYCSAWAKLNTKIGLSHHTHHTTTTTNFLTSCRHSRKFKLGKHLKDDIKKYFLEQNSTPAVIKLNTIAPQLVLPQTPPKLKIHYLIFLNHIIWFSIPCSISKKRCYILSWGLLRLCWTFSIIFVWTLPTP